MVTIVHMAARQCDCDLCEHYWYSIATLLPIACPKCHSRAWNGPKKVGRPPGFRDTSQNFLPKPKRVRTI